MDTQKKQCALSSFMKQFRAQALSNVKEIVIVDDNARRRRSSCRRLGNALKCGKCPSRRSFRNSRRWEAHHQATVSQAAPSSPYLSSESVADVNKDEEPGVRRRISGIIRPQRRASIERRDSIDSDTSFSSSISFFERSEESKEQELPAYGMALQMISQKYATSATATATSAPRSGVFDGSIRGMSLTPPKRRPSYGEMHSLGAHEGAQRRSSGIQLI